MALGSAAIAIHVYHHPKGFAGCHSMMPWKSNPNWEPALPTPAETQTLHSIFSQNYHFLSSGFHSYAFESEDGKYVIKFFRMNHLVPRTLHYLRPQKVAKRKELLDNLFNAYKNVYDRFRKDSGLLFIHLNKTSHINTILHVTDKKKMNHAVSLDRVAFVVQEKAEVLEDRLHRLKNEQKWEELQTTTQSFLELVKRRIEAGLTDSDLGILKNYGFIGDRPIHFDVGSVSIGTQPNEYDRLTEKISLTIQAL